LICGLLGALPMTGVIVRSSANVQAGARSRLSAILHGLWLLAFVALLGGLLRQIPIASLAGVLVYTGLKLADPKALTGLLRYGRMPALVYLATALGIVLTDLLTGVLVGFALTLLKLALKAARLK
ncbi:SulP family inorganic anion transporter, partial [Pseudomonas aeruginosa]